MRNFSPQAQADLDQTVGWLLDRGQAAGVAERLLTAVLDAAALVAVRPNLGRRQPDLLRDPFRVWSVPRHSLILVYDPSTKPPGILRVISTSQDFWPLLADLGPDLREPDQAG